MFEFGKDVTIEQGVHINVREGFIGDRSIIRSGARIEGQRVVLGTESYLDHGALIGGGSCFDEVAFLEAGCWFHMGWDSQVNIARGVEVGDEVGLGIETKIFTHGAYLPIDCGFPVQWAGVRIGRRVWLPNAWVNPGVTIGNNVVVAARSLVNKDLPPGCFAGGIPAKVIKENEYPRRSAAWALLEIEDDKLRCGRQVLVGDTVFNISERTIIGPVTEESEKAKNQLRRNGIRFKYYAKDGEYVPWNVS
jgi:acetyltransferase-like isoleucine patch superfamily enzyme